MKSFQEGLCGEPFKIWDGHFWGRCFEQLVILWPSYVILAILSSFYIGCQVYRISRYRRYVFIIQIRIVVTGLLFVCSFLNMAGSTAISGAKFFMVDYLTSLSVALAWLLHIGYLLKLKTGISESCRGPFKILVSFVVCLTTSLLNLICVALDDSLVKADYQLKICSASLTLVLLVAYCLTLIPDEREDDLAFGCDLRRCRGPALSAEEEQPLLQYVDDSEDEYIFESLLQPAESKNIFSRVFFWWLNPLIEKGFENCLRETKDLFVLPPALRAKSLYSKIATLLLLKPPEKPTNRPQMYGSDEFVFSNPNYHIRYDEDYKELSLFHSLCKCFGWEYIGIGILKLLSDGLAFSGPMLLNVIVSYLEGHDGLKQENSYWYAFALFVATFLGALFSTQYNFQISRIGLKIRTTIITALYGKLLALSKIKLSVYSSGQVMNFMSTDSDRIVNFCQSFHQFWSLPVQVIIIFYLLYQQLGLSFFIGVVVAAVLIFLNQYIAKKIGSFSRQMMEAKDRRIKLMSELFRGIRCIKIHAWEESFMKRIKQHRKGEISFLKKRKYLDALCVYLWATTPLIVAFLTFTTFVLLGNTLSASKIFTSIALFNMLIVPLNSFPWVLNGLVEACVSMKRIQEFFQLPSVYPDTYYGYPRGSTSVLSITEGIFGYGRQRNANNRNAPKKTFFLGNLNVQISMGELVCVVGKVGSGKSSFLYSILGDIVCHRGTVGLSEQTIYEGIGFVSQEPWIQRGSIRKNILFGRTLIPAYYQTVLEACALDSDLRTFRHGDKTEVGENGFTLSGGQRARIALARATYQNSEVYLIDDPFASVDDDVAKQIFEQCIRGLLREKAVVLCTRHMEFAAKADYVIHLDDGKVVSEGDPKTVLKPDFFTNELKIRAQNGECSSERSPASKPVKSTVSKTETSAPDQLVKEEERDNGIVKSKVYKAYWNAAGTRLAVLVMMCCFLMQSFRTLSDWWLSYWVSRANDTVAHMNASMHNASTLRTEKERDDVTFYLYVYGGLVAFNSLFGLARAFSFAFAGILAAVNLHNQLLQKVMKVSISFFDITPMGRILNRFSSDVYNVDDTLPFSFNILLAQVFSLGGCLVVTCYGMSWVACIFIPLVLFYYRTQKMYRYTSRELKRLCSISLSPLYAHFTETISGHSVIRALRNTARFTRECIMKLEENTMAMYASMAAAQWLDLRLQFIGVAVVTVIAFIALIQDEYGQVDPGLVGLTLAYALSLQSLLNGSITAYTETEKEMISVERILQYAEDLAPEDDGNNQAVPRDDWPNEGEVTFDNVFLQYRPERLPVVEDVSFNVRPGDKIGIIGRTGSGKTTLIMALLRMVNTVHGRIRIDGLDISALDLKALRSRLSVVPQDPFLFEGTVRENLDPCGHAADEDVMVALTKCHLFGKVLDLGGLNGHVMEGGQNFSTGEKQLLCLARALLRKSKVVCMDEATSSIDNKTDDLVQKTIREAFSSTTVFVIAHKLTTLQHCNYVIIMDGGKIIRGMTPKDLLSENEASLSRFLGDQRKYGI